MRPKRRWQEIGAGEDLTQDERLVVADVAELERWNGVVECALTGSDADLAEFASHAPVASWWEAWLWGTDPMEPTTVRAPLNRCQLQGLLLCRALSLQGVACGAPLCQIVKGCDALISACHDVPIGSMNIRHFKDALANINTQWVGNKGWKVEGVGNALLFMSAQLGLLACTAIPKGVVDDDESVEPIPGQKDGSNRVTRACVRRCLNILMVLFRSIKIHDMATPPPARVSDAIEESLIKRHHTLAGEDEFHTLSMHWDLPGAAVLNYAHDFSGMYTHVSQVAFYLDPEYAKRNPRSREVDAIASGSLGPLYTLPAIMQLYPDAAVVHSDELLDRVHGSGKPPAWLMMDQQVFLLAGRGRVYQDDNVVELMHALAACLA